MGGSPAAVVAALAAAAAPVAAAALAEAAAAEAPEHRAQGECVFASSPWVLSMRIFSAPSCGHRTHSPVEMFSCWHSSWLHLLTSGLGRLGPMPRAEQVLHSAGEWVHRARR